MALLAAAVGIVLAVPDDSTALISAQAFAAVLLGGGGLAALAGSSFLADLQKE